MQQQVDYLVKLQRLFPTYPFAAKQMFNEISMVGTVRFRDAIILLAENEKTRHEINQYAKELNSKIIQVNNLQYLARFKELLAFQEGKPIIKVSGKIIPGIERRPRKKVEKVDPDEDVDGERSEHPKKSEIKPKRGTKIDSDGEQSEPDKPKKTNTPKKNSKKVEKKESSSEEDFNSDNVQEGVQSDEDFEL